MSPSPEPEEVAARGAAAKIHPFAVMAGTWTGGGTIDLTNDIHEKLRCRANYTYGQGNSSLALAIRCASDNYKFELTSNVVERGGQISGTWNETAYGVSGSISGRVNGGRISAVARGDSFTAALSVNTNGNRQSVTITPERTYIINVQIGLGKAGGTADRGALACARPALRVDLRHHPAQLRRERPEPVAAARAVAGLAGLLQRRRRVPTPLAPIACAAPLSLWAAAASAARLPFRDALSISRWVSTAVSRNLPSSESIAERSSPSQAPSTLRSIALPAGAPFLAAWPLPPRSTESQRSSVVRSRSMFTGLTR